MRVMIFEHICGGGMAGGELPEELAAQGAAMLSAAVDDFHLAGASVVTTLDARLEMSLGVVYARKVASADRLNDAFDAMARSADAVLVIAPEFDGVLEQWEVRLDALGVRSLGCHARAIRLCADKLALGPRLRSAGVPTPDTVPVAPWRGWTGEVIIKPRFGAGCEHTYIVEAAADEPAPVKHCHGEAIMQPFVKGRAASASFIVRGDREAAPLLAGWQNISCRDAGPGRRVLAYDGGELPADEHHSMRAIALARRAVAAVRGLRGFVGVDVVLGDGPRDDVVIEINPRLTMSYVALRRLCIDNLAAALVFPDAPIRWRPGRVAFDAAGRLRAEQPA